MRASVLLAAVAALALPAPALAQEQAPQPRCGLSFSDPANDSTSQVPTQARALPPALDITRVFFDHAPGRAGATTVNIRVRDLSTALPLGTTSINWTAVWLSPAGNQRFVRAVADYQGSVIFEFGEAIVQGITRFEPRGVTTGKLFPGPDGVVSIAIPDTWDGAAGTLLDGIYVQASEGRQVIPNAVSSPTRGLSQQADRAPDGTDIKAWTIAGCPPPTAT
jgi:hypothetical protein